MSRKLQWFSGGIRTSTLFQVFGFFAVFYLLRWALFQTMILLLPLGGYSPQASLQLAESNEIFIQTLALLASLWVVFRERGRSTRKFLLSELLGESERGWPRSQVWVASSIAPFFWGFVWASVGVGISLFSGFLRIESGLSGAYWLFLIPMLLLRMAGLFLWVLALELMRLKLSRVMAPSQTGDFVGNVALVIFEASLLFAVFRADASPMQQILMVLVAAWIAALLGLWTLKTRNSIFASWRRVCWTASFVVTLVCVYGFPLSWGRVASLTTLYAGESSWALAWAPHPSFLAQWSFFLMFSYFGIRLLRMRNSNFTRS